MHLGRYREQIQTLLKTTLVPDRFLRPLLFLAALYHDIGKPESQQQTSESGRIRFLEHERIGAEIMRKRGRGLALSNQEVDWLETVIKHHMRPTWLAREPKQPSKRSTYRFFRDTGNAGAAICFLSLADLLATYGVTLPQDRWSRQLDVVRELLEAWWENRTENLDPPAILSGNDLLDEFDIKPGPMIGEILEALRESQATGKVSNREEALEFVSVYLKEV
jgi:putative nucleotidyltransferase with HDIG domain